MKGTHKHSEAYQKRFDSYRCLSQSEESKCLSSDQERHICVKEITKIWIYKYKNKSE